MPAHIRGQSMRPEEDEVAKQQHVRSETRKGIDAQMLSSPSRVDPPEFDIAMAVSKRPAGTFRRFIHRHMLRFDERACRTLRFPPDYMLPDDETGQRLRDLLKRLASGKVTAFYDNGLRVPRSIFHSRSAGLLFSSLARSRVLVITPYFFCSVREISVSAGEFKAPWGGFSDR